MKIQIRILALMTCLLLGLTIYAKSSLAADVSVAWDPETGSTLAGYRIYHGTASRTYGSPIDVGNVTAYTLSGLQAGTHYFAVTAYDSAGYETPYSNEVTASVGAAMPADSALYLIGNRFTVQVNWNTSNGGSGQGMPVPLTSDSGSFWFFRDTNVELLVKILDGRQTNGHFWFFWGAMTDVQYTITVTDTQTGAVKHYYGTQGVQQSGNDVNAF